MGRPRKDAGQGLPLRVYLKSGQFYYVHQDTRWEGLGRDLAAAKLKADAYNANAPLAGAMAEWLTKWHVYLAKQQAKGALSPRTVADYKKDSLLLTEFFGKMYPAEIQASHVTEYLDLGVDLDRPVRANREKAALSSCLSWMLARSHGGLVRNYCLDVPRNPETPRARYIDDDEYNAVYAKACAPTRAMMVLIYRTLQRPSDVLAWTRRNIIEQDGQRVLRFTQSKTGKPMAILLNAEIDAALQAVRAARTVDGLPLVCTRDGQSYTEMGIASMFRRHVVSAGIKNYALYDHKAKGATDMHADGVPLETICSLCGHDSVKTTEVYIKQHARVAVKANSRVIKASKIA